MLPRQYIKTRVWIQYYLYQHKHLKMLSLKISKILEGFEMSLVHFTRSGSTSFTAPSSPVTASHPPHQGQPADYSFSHSVHLFPSERKYILSCISYTNLSTGSQFPLKRVTVDENTNQSPGSFSLWFASEDLATGTLMDTYFPGATKLVFYGKCRQCICGRWHLSTAVLDINTEFGGEALPPSASLYSTCYSPAKAHNVLGVRVYQIYIPGLQNLISTITQTVKKSLLTVKNYSLKKLQTKKLFCVFTYLFLNKGHLKWIVIWSALEFCEKFWLNLCCWWECPCTPPLLRLVNFTCKGFPFIVRDDERLKDYQNQQGDLKPKFYFHVTS